MRNNLCLLELLPLKRLALECPELLGQFLETVVNHSLRHFGNGLWRKVTAIPPLRVPHCCKLLSTYSSQDSEKLPMSGRLTGAAATRSVRPLTQSRRANTL